MYFNCSDVNTLAIVETPLQLLCAYEAVAWEPAHVVVLRLSSVKNNDAHMLALAKFLDLRYVVLNIPVGVGIVNILSALWPLRMLVFKRYKSIYLGSYFSRLIRGVSVLFGGRKYFLDDGMATLLSLKEMKRKREVFALFTFFDIDPLPGQLYIRHYFERIRTKFTIVGKGGSYFIGQPLVQKNIMAMDDYLFLIKKAISMSDGVLFYVPHRVECEQTLHEISLLDGVRITPMNSAIEIELLLKGKTPCAVFSCFSTALLTLSILFPESNLVSFLSCASIDSNKVPHRLEIEHAIRKSSNITI